MRTIQIHKNDLKEYFVKKGKTKIGEEQMIRWVDVPEYILIPVEKKHNTDKLKEILLQIVNEVSYQGQFFSKAEAEKLAKKISSL